MVHPVPTHICRRRMAAVLSVLLLPILCGAAAEDSIEFNGGGGQYRFGLCGTASRTDFSQAVVRGSKQLADDYAVGVDLGAAHEQEVITDSDTAQDLGETSSNTFLFSRLILDYQGTYIGGRLGAVLLHNGRRFGGTPAYRLRLGPRAIGATVDASMGGLRGCESIDSSL